MFDANTSNIRSQDGQQKLNYRTGRDDKDRRFIPVFIELLRAGDIDLVNPAKRLGFIRAFSELSGENFGEDWTEVFGVP